MEEDLYKAVIHTALKDLFVKKEFVIEYETKADGYEEPEEITNREEAWAWFESNIDYSENHITFIDACDLAGYDYKQWRYVAHLIYIGKLNKKEYLELMTPTIEFTEPKYPVMLNYAELKHTPGWSKSEKYPLENSNLYAVT